ncbi:hypothetical protein ACLKA7_005499, partial [Drosophila subpalustris]
MKVLSRTGEWILRQQGLMTVWRKLDLILQQQGLMTVLQLDLILQQQGLMTVLQKLDLILNDSKKKKGVAFGES